MRATWDGTNYIATGTKVWPTMASTAARIMLLARTTPIDQCKRPVDGLTLFYAPLDRRYVETSKIAKLGRNAMESCTVFFDRSEEHTSELQSLMRISYAVFCLKKKITT